MTESVIVPHRINKPIQLLAVWFSALVLLVTILLTAAARMESHTWLKCLLTLSAIVLIPFFALLVYRLQTRYRRELTEDESYVLMALADEERTEVDRRSVEEAAAEFDRCILSLREVIKTTTPRLPDETTSKLTLVEEKHEELLFNISHVVGSSLQHAMFLTHELWQEVTRDAQPTNEQAVKYARLRQSLQRTAAVLRDVVAGGRRRDTTAPY